MKNVFFYLDKKGAEWVVVAFLSGDSRMMEVCRSGENPHIITASHMFGLPPEVILKERKALEGVSGTLEIRRARAALASELAPASFLPASLPLYDCGKRSNHGLNYKEGYKGFALINGIMEGEAKRIVEGYTGKMERVGRTGRKVWEYVGVYPGVARWHDETEARVRRDKALTTPWGRKIPFMGTLDASLFRKAYSAVPQSTVVDLVNRAMVNAHRTRTPAFSRAQILQQTHDSLTYQYPLDALPDAAAFLSTLSFGGEYMNPLLTWEGREFRIGTDLKVGFSLGAMHDCPITPDAHTQLTNLQSTITKIKLHAFVENNVDVTCLRGGEYAASILRLNVAMVGKSESEAITLLEEHIACLHNELKSARSLGPEPTRQLGILEDWLACWDGEKIATPVAA